jgi:DNA-binding MarR family transcriptional regulator
VEPNKRKLVDQFVNLIEQLYFQIRSHPMEAWSDIELTMPQLRTLFFLSTGSKRMGEIATYLGIVLSSATTVVNAVVDKGLVERFQELNDRRVVLCRLTPIGLGEVERLWHIRRIRAEAIANLLTPQELESVVEAMEILGTAVGREPPVCSSDTARDEAQ